MVANIWKYIFIVLVIIFTSLFSSCGHQVYYYQDDSATKIAFTDRRNYREGEEVVVLPGMPFQKEGYSFKEWNTQSDGLGEARSPGNTFLMGESDAGLFPIWDANKYSVLLDWGDGLTTKVEATFEAPLPSISKIPEYSNIRLIGFYDNEHYEGTQYYDSNLEGIKLWDKTDLTRLYARVDLNLIADAGGLGESLIEVNRYGAKVNEMDLQNIYPANEVKDWYKDSNLTQKWDFEVDTVKDNTRIYAKLLVDPRFYAKLPFEIEGWYWPMWEAPVSLLVESKDRIILKIKFENGVYNDVCRVVEYSGSLRLYPENASDEMYVLVNSSKHIDVHDNEGKYDRILGYSVDENDLNKMRSIF